MPVRATRSDPDRAQVQLLRAASATQARIERHLRRSSVIVQALLGVIRDRIFEASFDVNALRRACGHAASFSDALFHHEIGDSAWAYISQGRLETAAHLLRDTDLLIGEVAELVGYADSGVFRQAFKRSTGSAPGAFRKRTRLLEHRAANAGREVLGLEFLEQLRQGTLEAPGIHRVLELFASHAGLADGNRRTREDEAARTGPTQNAEIRIEETKPAKWFWQLVTGLSHERSLLWAKKLPVVTPAFFELLGGKIEKVGRRDPAGALRLAELAEAHLNRNAETFEPETQGLRARALAWHANALRLNHDFDAAARCFANAWHLWEIAGRPPCVEAEMCDFEAALLREQRRNEDALERLNRAASLAQAHGLPRVLVTALLQRVVLVAYFGGKPQAAIEDLRLALQHLEGQDEPYLRLAAYSNLASAYTLAGQHRDALEVLPRARALCDELGERTTHFILKWTEGLARRDLGETAAAQRLFEQARDGFIERDARDNAAVVALDLALLHLAEGRPGEAARLGSEAIPIFESLGIVPEKLGAAKLLREAITAGDLTAQILRGAREALERALRNPARG